MSLWVFQHTDGVLPCKQNGIYPSIPSAYCFGINPKLTGSFSDEFPCIQQPAILALILYK